MGDERLADLGALLVFRHWLRCQLDELAAVSPEAPASGLPLAQQAPINDKEGRANRAKYCREWDPAVSMDRIVKAFPVTEEETA